MIKFFANIFGYLLNFIYGLVSNYGVAIIIFTVILKLLMLPISVKQQKTMKKSAKMQVKMREIQEKYANDQVRQSQELMDLYKKEKMSPFSGCLSSILQMIIVLAMFYLVSQPLTYMKNIDSTVIDSYANQITEESGEALRYREISIIKEMADKDENVNINMNFLGLDLSDIPTQDYKNWKVYIIPGLYVLTSLVSMKITTKLNNTSKDKMAETKTSDENSKNKELDAMEEMNKQMIMMMPIMTVMIALVAPLGLALYWLVSNLIIIVERILLNKVFNEEVEE